MVHRKLSSNQVMDSVCFVEHTIVERHYTFHVCNHDCAHSKVTWAFFYRI